MAEELKLINANSREDANLSPLSKIEIYSFFDPFNGDFVDRAQTFSLASVIFNKKEGGFGRKADPVGKRKNQ